MGPDTNRPVFQLFRRVPPGAKGQLISSMQSFESGLFLLALGRYPHALSTIFSAIESAIQAALSDRTKRPRQPKKGKSALEALLDDARDANPLVAAFPENKVDALRRARNHIVHSGYTPRDDHPSAAIILSTATPLLSAVYRGFFAFSLEEALVEEVGDHLSIARRAFDEVPDLHREAVACFALLGPFLRTGMRRAGASLAETRIADHAEASGRRFEAVRDHRAELEAALNPSLLLDCPVCGEPDTLVCELAEDALGAGNVVLSRAGCAACDLVVTPAQAPVLRIACAEALQRNRATILQDFGIEPR